MERMEQTDRRPDVAAVRDYLLELQDAICAELERVDGSARFRSDDVERPGGGRSRPRVLEGGEHVERSAVNFSHTRGARLPEAGTQRKPELAGQPFEAASLSLIVHPRNPYAPTTHMNVRAFCASEAGAPATWWFGGGFDLTPYYGFEEDCVHWHATARDAVGAERYPRMKQWCDEYFFLPHRGEPRGIGGVFFDDWSEGGFEQSFALLRGVGDAFVPAYVPILERRVNTPYGERERDFQLLRRGRYVEFNLVYDRGTRFGLQAGGRAESILGSMPPEVRWRYSWEPEPGSPEAALLERFLPPRDWLAEDAP